VNTAPLSGITDAVQADDARAAPDTNFVQMRETMPKKASRLVFQALAAAGFIYTCAFGQESMEGMTPVDSTQINAELSAPSGGAATPAPPVPAQKTVTADSAAPAAPAGQEPVRPFASPLPATGGGPDTVSQKQAVSEKVLELDRDVVVGYGTMKKEDLTGSVISIKSDDIVKDAVFSVRKALQGRAAGVYVTQNSGAPGKSITVRVRGVGTINNSDPLYIVDEVPVNSIDFVNPNDMEEITVLKDASATAIYGSRGANGVVMITTKKPKEGTSRVAYDMFIGMQRPWKKPSLCNAEQWAMLNNEARRAANLPVYDQLENPSSLGKGTDWLDEITNTNALIQQQVVSIARGTDHLKYYLSAGYFNQEGIIRGSELRKITLRFNAENKIASWVSLGNNFGLANCNTDYVNESDEWNGALINALAMDPVTKPRDEKGNFVPSVFNNMKNPVGILENTNMSTKKTALTGTFYAKVDIFNVLKFKSTFGLDMGFNDSSCFVPKYYISPSDRNDNAIVTRKNFTDNTWDIENTLTYQRTFAEDHSVKLMAGATAQARGWDSVSAQNQTTPSNDSTMRVLNATTGLNPIVRGNMGGNSLKSGLGRLEYEYQNKYLLTCSFRSDGSSRFAEGKRWINFPSVAGAWKISQEPFMTDVTFIEALKLRLGWGKTGNQEIPDYLYTTTTSGGQNYPFGGIIYPGTTYLSAGNDQIHWESQTASNAGLDMIAWGGKIEFNVDAYIKKTGDMLVQPPIPYMTGLRTSPMVNAGSVENKGLELVLNYRESRGDFLSNVGINFSTYSNKVLDLGSRKGKMPDGDYRNLGMVTLTEANHPIGSFYGLKTNGLFQSWDDVKSFTYFDEKDSSTKLVQPNAAPGDIRYRDDDHDGKPDVGYIGSPHPDFIMGLSVDLAYKGFDVSLALQGVYGNQVFNGTRFYTENGTGSYNLDTRMLDRWTGPGSTSDVTLPRMNNGDANNLLLSDRYIEDGSYLRLKTVQLGYRLDESLVKKLWIKSCRVYIGAENLVTLTKYRGMEPEVGMGSLKNGTKNTSLTIGIDRTTYPQALTLLFGCNLTL
jgi:TonB-dependent starch-binding outer membrane protein SusC